MKTNSVKLAVVAAGLVVAMPGRAGEVYGGIGLPGLMLGYAHQVNGQLVLRGDFATLGRRSQSRAEEGVDYAGKVEAYRVGAFADWFALGGGFRLTGGVTFNTYKLALAAKSTTGVTIGGNVYTGSSLDVTIKFPDTTPYIGIGYGHHAGKGLGFVWDLGASVGTAKVTATTVGFPDSAQFTTDLNQELAQLRKGVGKIKVLPQASIALSYKF